MFTQKTYTLTELANNAINWINNLSPTQFIFLAVLGSLIIAQNSPQKTISYYSKLKPIPRKDFTKSTKDLTLMIQGFICKRCKNPSKLWDFHHKDGNRSNNRPSNCEALCPNCHAEKTRK